MTLDKRFAFLLWLGRMAGRSFAAEASVRSVRAAYVRTNARFGLKPCGDVDTCDVTIPASDGATIAGRLYRPRGVDGELPVLVYFHGGGWVIGDIDVYDPLTRFFAHEGRLAVLAVAYRLGPEHRFPRGHEDAFDAYAWLLQHAAELRVDPARVAVGGDSAGGGLAAAIAAYAESRRLARPAYALLIYPSVDTSARFPSRSQYTRNLPLTPASIGWFNTYAIGDPADVVHPLLIPLDAPHPERHPSAYILAAGFDPLVDEGHAYYLRLRAAGVRVTYDLRPTLPHAFVNFAGVIPEARKALAAGIAATAAALGARPAKVVALSGAGSGIGRALAIELARRDYVLALADRDRAGLAATAELVRTQAIVSTHVVDVASHAAVDAFAAATLAAHGRIDVVINNAGVSLAGDVAELSVQEIAWLMDTNFWGTVYGVKAFLPALMRTPGATIVNMSSVFGLVAPPGQAAYAASKFAVRGFSEALREELRGQVHVLSVHPGGIKTNIARSARIAAAADQALHRRRAQAFEERMLTQTPETAARLIVRGIERRSDRVLIGADAGRIEVLTRVFGPRAARIFATLASRGTRGTPAGSAKRRAGAG